MSEPLLTPRTDMETFKPTFTREVVEATFARRLERENNVMREALREIEQSPMAPCDSYQDALGRAKAKAALALEKLR